MNYLDRDKLYSLIDEDDSLTDAEKRAEYRAEIELYEDERRQEEDPGAY